MQAEGDNIGEKDDAETQRSNRAAIDQMMDRNAVDNPRLVGLPSTLGRRAALVSDLWDDMKQMEWNSGRD